MRTIALLLAIAIAIPCFAEEEFQPYTGDPARDARFNKLREEATPYIKFGEQLIDLMAKGDAKGVKERLSPDLTKRYGEAKVDEFVNTKLIPYFAKLKTLDPEGTVVTRGSAPDGRSGFVIQYAFDVKGEDRHSVVMYLFERDGRTVAENIVPGRNMDEAARLKKKQTQQQ